MADNVTAPATGASLATDDVGGVHYPRIKISVGGEGVAADVTTGNGFPVTLVSGGFSTSAKQDAQTTAIEAQAPATRWFAITPANSALATVPDAIYVSVAGNLVARGSDGTDATFVVVAGQILPIKPTQVRTGTTATVIGLVN